MKNVLYPENTVIPISLGFRTRVFVENIIRRKELIRSPERVTPVLCCLKKAFVWAIEIRC
jgi:hypothetical protein